MGLPLELIGLLGVAIVATPATALVQQRFAVPSGTIASTIDLLSRQAGATIGTNDASVLPLPTRPVSGRRALPAALATWLDGSGARAVPIDSSTWRIERAPIARPRSRKMVRPDAPPEATPEAIVVTGSRRGIALADYAGSAALVQGASIAPAQAARGSEALLEQLSMLSATALGAGRNKLFIRGVADSSFNGPTESTIGQYLGDVRLAYNAPDPDLDLYDVASVEVLEGPQGTLYGAGALGGIIRIVPNPPEPGQFGASFAAGRSFTGPGADGYDLAGMLNVPLAGDMATARLVLDRKVDGGYIHDAGRGLSDVNATLSSGGRTTLRISLGDGWTFDLGGVVQNIFNEDGQYAERGAGDYARVSRIAQPFDDDFALGSIVAGKRWDDGLQLTSATGVVRQTADSTFDFTAAGGPPTAFTQHNGILMISSEAHLSRRGTDGAGWIVGTSFLHDRERLDRGLGPLPTPGRILGVLNDVDAGALYGEGGVQLGHGLVATIGARVEVQSQRGEPQADEGADPDVHRRKTVFLPSVGFSWRVASAWSLFARYHEGYRPGGLSVAETGVAQRFESDSVRTVEAGVRYGGQTGPIAAMLTLSRVGWTDIQADLIDSNGLPFTRNIGDGRILGMEATLAWHPAHPVAIEANLFLNDSDLTAAAPGSEAQLGHSLPNVAAIGARGAISTSLPLEGGWTLRSQTSLRYTGRSSLAVGGALELPQGNYFELTSNIAFTKAQFSVSVDATNVLGTVGNRFALGNPYDVALGRQFVPLRPRTVRLGAEVKF